MPFLKYPGRLNEFLRTSIVFQSYTFGCSWCFGCLIWTYSTMRLCYGDYNLGSTLLSGFYILLTKPILLTVLIFGELWPIKGLLSFFWGFYGDLGWLTCCDFGGDTTGLLLLMGWFRGVICGTGLTGSGVLAGWVAGDLAVSVGLGSYLTCLLTGLIPPPKRRSSMSFSKLDFLLFASKDCFSYFWAG